MMTFFKLSDDRQRRAEMRKYQHKVLRPLHIPKAHTKARNEPPDYIVAGAKRFGPIPDELVPWTVPFDGYRPIEFTHDDVKQNALKPAHDPARWAEDLDVHAIADLRTRSREGSYEGSFELDPGSGRPLNPRGRTGICGRGLLGRWGPNYAVDPIVTRRKPGSRQQLQMIAVQRRDITGRWGIPGRMIKASDIEKWRASPLEVALDKALDEELLNLDVSTRAKLEQAKNKLRDLGGRLIYQGYVDDPRNTDNAWMETMSFHFHCTDEIGALLPLRSGEDTPASVGEQQPQASPTPSPSPRRGRVCIRPERGVDDDGPGGRAALREAVRLPPAAGREVRGAPAPPRVATGARHPR